MELEKISSGSSGYVSERERGEREKQLRVNSDVQYTVLLQSFCREAGAGESCTKRCLYLRNDIQHSECFGAIQHSNFQPHQLDGLKLDPNWVWTGFRLGLDWAVTTWLWLLQYQFELLWYQNLNMLPSLPQNEIALGTKNPQKNMKNSQEN